MWNVIAILIFELETFKKWKLDLKMV